MTTFSKIVLFTGEDGRAQFREELIPLEHGTAESMLTEVFVAGGYQLRLSPVGFRSEFHCSQHTQWVFILQGQMEIGVHGGTSRIFQPGEHFYSADLLPPGQIFNPSVHGHWSRQVGEHPLVTLFVRG